MCCFVCGAWSWSWHFGLVLFWFCVVVWTFMLCVFVIYCECTGLVFSHSPCTLSCCASCAWFLTSREVHIIGVSYWPGYPRVPTVHLRMVDSELHEMMIFVLVKLAHWFAGSLEANSPVNSRSASRTLSWLANPRVLNLGSSNVDQCKHTDGFNITPPFVDVLLKSHL